MLKSFNTFLTQNIKLRVRMNVIIYYSFTLGNIGDFNGDSGTFTPI